MIESVQCGWYQNVSVGEPDGRVTVCVSTLSPLNALGEPRRAEYEPVCGVVEITGSTAPLAVQPLRPAVSNRR